MEYATETEQALLGLLLQWPNQLAKVADILATEYFSPRYRPVWQTITSLANSGEPHDYVAVTNSLGQNTAENLLPELLSKAGSASRVERYAATIADRAIRENAADAARRVLASVENGDGDIADTLDQACSYYKSLIDHATIAPIHSIAPAVDTAIRRIEQARNHPGIPTGITSGFPAIDRITFGFQPSDLIIIAARPAMGKTAFALSALLNIARTGTPVGIFSIEMSELQLANRLISQITSTCGDDLRSGNIHNPQTFYSAIDSLRELPIYVDDSATRLSDIRARAIRMVRNHGVRLLVVDYLQLVSAPAEGIRNSSRENVVAAVSRGLKGLAKELNIPVIALAQVNRQVESRTDTTPKLADLRESGAIEQDADLVAFLHRPEYYDPDNITLHGRAQFIIAKNRNGAVASVDLSFTPELAMFAPLPDNNCPF